MKNDILFFVFVCVCVCVSFFVVVIFDDDVEIISNKHKFFFVEKL